MKVAKEILLPVEANRSSEIELAEGFTLNVHSGDKAVSIRNKNGQNLLQIDISADGLSVKIQDADNLHLSARKIDLHATEQINMVSEGNLVQQVGKDMLTEVDGNHKQIAASHTLAATTNDVKIKANDYVKIDGERVLLNS